MNAYSVLATLPLICALPAWADPCYQGQGPKVVSEVLELDGIESLRVRAGAGALTILGSDGNRIEMEADAYVGETTEYRLVLERQGSEAVIQALVDDDRQCRGEGHPYIDLVVRVPAGINVHASDGSGDLKVARLQANLHLEDGSGNAEILGVGGRATIGDGSGNLVVRDIQGETRIEDGSGNLVVSGIDGDIRIEDGSGNLKVQDVQGDLRVDDGSGNITISQVTGTVTIDDGSGDILVEQAGDVKLEDTGSGSVELSAVGRDRLK
ncbi:DUF4097 family beta strand repeat-containing protein [Ferrimonas sp.]|uniref:DUF4097 family beta strand repeat-containing protein n=1 Tax=Ferrimonas sp. TaxID=2080861 RepID=UPI003A945BFA